MQAIEYIKFLTRVDAALEHAANMFQLPKLKETEIRFDLKGLTAGKASAWSNGQSLNRQGRSILWFNPEAIEKELDDMIQTTIPHEIAHLVCMMKPELGKGHNVGWKRVCKELGGDGERCHTYALVPARKSRQWLYCNSTGREYTFKTRAHNNMQKRSNIFYTVDGKYKFNRFDFVKEINND